MAFNSNTYHANKSAKSAWKQIKDARALRARIRSGEAYDWEIDRLPNLIKYARWDMHRSIFYRNQNK